MILFDSLKILTSLIIAELQELGLTSEMSIALLLFFGVVLIVALVVLGLALAIWLRPPLQGDVAINGSEEESRSPDDAPQLRAKVKAASVSDRLQSSRGRLLSRIQELFGRGQLDTSLLDDLEEILITSDLGVATTDFLLGSVKERIKKGEDLSVDVVREILRAQVIKVVAHDVQPVVAIKDHDQPLVIMMVGVNGVGKTTTSAKLAWALQRDGVRVLLAAADTFRAAAVEQLVAWGERLGVTVHRGAEGAKPATVAYEAVRRSLDENFGVVIIDTAGRLHNRANLMQELGGIKNAIQKLIPTAPDEVLLVVDGNSGQNALVQAREFHAVTSLSGLVVTKLDGTARGGVVVAIASELGIPVRYIGVGEAPEDLRCFDAVEFSDALLGARPEHVISAHGLRRQEKLAQSS